MDFWHIQMHLPAGKNGISIDSKKMLEEPKPVIGTGEWDDLQCEYFKGLKDGLEIGSIVMVRRGNEPIALVKVISEYFKDAILEKKYLNALYRYVEVLDWNTTGFTSSLFSQGTLKLLYESRNTDSWNFINNWYQNVLKMTDIKNAASLLIYKKQIILQGPPGTGKTKRAKEIAREIAMPQTITQVDIQANLSIGQNLKSATDYTIYTVKAIGNSNVTVGLKNNNSEYKPSYKEIIKAFETRMWNGGQISGNDPYAAAIAKYLFHMIPLNTVKLVQFHPSYSYEDFVRGIVAESNDKVIEYVSVNKILGEFANEANDNYKLSQKDNTEAQIDKWISETFNDFKTEIEKEIEQGEVKLSDNIGIFAVDGNCFRYGKDWKFQARLNFSDFKKLIKAKLAASFDENQTSIPKNISLHAHYRATYYLSLLRQFFTKHEFVLNKEISERKNYVLIVDEINRANLSSVLGELIYALEYRGEEVESMYKVENNNKLVLPPNLYLIGTMNTADRSVGHIDYAIRRRFAFIDLVPKDLSSESEITFAKDLFDKVSDLFNTNLSAEFERKDVALGHSYFIDKSSEGGSMVIRLEYEIKPILLEYVKDGILIGNVNNETPIKEYIEQLQVTL